MLSSSGDGALPDKNKERGNSWAAILFSHSHVAGLWSDVCLYFYSASSRRPWMHVARTLEERANAHGFDEKVEDQFSALITWLRILRQDPTYECDSLTTDVTKTIQSTTKNVLADDDDSTAN